MSVARNRKRMRTISPPQSADHPGLQSGTHLGTVPDSHGPSRTAHLLAVTAVSFGTAGISGCDRAPSYSILGSFFPVWLLCFILGMLFTFGVHLLLQRLRLANQLTPAVLVYPSLTALFTMALWLIFYS